MYLVLSESGSSVFIQDKNELSPDHTRSVRIKREWSESECGSVRIRMGPESEVISQRWNLFIQNLM